MLLDIAQHAVVGAVVAVGGVAAAQCAVARRLQAPGSLALALGGFVGMFRLAEASGRQLQQQQQQNDNASTASRPDTNSARAAALAAIVALTLLDAKRKSVMISYATIEALVQLGRDYTSLASIKYIEIPLGVPVFAQLIYTWVMQSDNLAQSHVAALDGLCALDASVVQRMRQELPQSTRHLRCDVFHRNASCSRFHATLFYTSMRFAARLYVPIYVVSTVLPKYKQWLFGPRPALLLRPLALQYVRTCLCLTLMYQLPLVVSCGRPFGGGNHSATVTLAGAVAALALLAEHERRRASVLQAVAVYALCSTGTQVVAVLQASRRFVGAAQYALFAAALALVFRRPERQSRVLLQLLYGRDVRGRVATQEEKTTIGRPAGDEKDAQ